MTTETQSNVVQIHPTCDTTYKVLEPFSEELFFVTISDLILNSDTRKLYEITIKPENRRCENHWIIILVRLFSGKFRNEKLSLGHDKYGLALHAVFDPKEGCAKKNGVETPSFTNKIGKIIQCHLVIIGMIEANNLDKQQQSFIEGKLASQQG